MQNLNDLEKNRKKLIYKLFLIIFCRLILPYIICGILICLVACGVLHDNSIFTVLVITYWFICLFYTLMIFILVIPNIKNYYNKGKAKLCDEYVLINNDEIINAFKKFKNFDFDHFSYFEQEVKETPFLNNSDFIFEGRNQLKASYKDFEFKFCDLKVLFNSFTSASEDLPVVFVKVNG